MKPISKTQFMNLVPPQRHGDTANRMFESDKNLLKLKTLTPFSEEIRQSGVSVSLWWICRSIFAFFLLMVLGTGALASTVPGTGSSPLVPSGDGTYAQLAQLEQTGLLPAGSSSSPLTRMEVAGLVFQAREHLKEIILAQADDVPPPPPSDNSSPTSSSPAAPEAAPSVPTAPVPVPAAPAPAAPEAAAPVVAVPTATPSYVSPIKSESQDDLIKAEADLHSLEEAYDYELKKVQADMKTVQDRQGDLENKQYDLWKRLMGITEYPTISWHGLGRVYGISQQFYGDSQVLPLLSPSSRSAIGFLDFEPVGIVDKQIRWDAIIRYESAMESNVNVGIDSLVARRINMEFNPPWFSATIGDFNESYTPLTMWNRDNLDLRYKPEMIAREDDFQKYESFLNDEPNWPFRGVRVGTDILWPDSSFIDRFKIGGMANMIRSGFNDNASGGSYFGPGDFTDWIFAAQSEIKLKRWYVGGFSLQLALDAYGVMLDEPLYSEQPGSPYSPANPNTWAHQYTISSLKPSFDVGLQGDAGFGGTWEGAFSTYEDDKMDPGKNVSDYAILAGPYFRLGHSKITFNYLNVGPNYFSPLAQTRQDDLLPSSPYSNVAVGGLASPDLLSAPQRSQFFLSNVPRAGGIFSFYDRTQDNTFPYGLATPNREGFGFDFDVKASDKDALKIPGSIYFVQEISDNLVVNQGATGYVSVDAVAGVPNPIRTFKYVNIGPSFNFAPLTGLPGDLEIGANVRYEQTNSAIGTLTSDWILGGLRAEIFSWWEAAASFGVQNISGSEAGWGGTTLARYAYEFDNTDLTPGYSAFSINGSRQSWKFSSDFRTDRNSTLYFDYSVTWDNAIPYVGQALSGTLYNQFMEVTYAIQF